MNVDYYLKRIGLSNTPIPNLQYLTQLQKAHLFNVPFENLDIHLGNKIKLDLENFYNKIVNRNRGGFCYELNGLFAELLINLGFNVRRISAKIFSAKNGYGKEFDHLTLLVKINNDEYLTDVGFGEFIFSPLKFELSTEQNDNGNKFYFDRYDREYFRINKIEEGEIIPQFIFKNIDRKLTEFNYMCSFHQLSSESHFTQKKVITLPIRNGRITLTNDKLKITDQGIIKETEIMDKNEFDKYLHQYFKIMV